MNAQHPLVTCLLVLYGLSMLARYHPMAWRRMLDVDANRRAAPLEPGKKPIRLGRRCRYVSA